ncbi:MAG: hypothetical protein AAF558_06550, partial [Verrucomicrobiota bacterium]
TVITGAGILLLLLVPNPLSERLGILGVGGVIFVLGIAMRVAGKKSSVPPVQLDGANKRELCERH